MLIHFCILCLGLFCNFVLTDKIDKPFDNADDEFLSVQPVNYDRDNNVVINLDLSTGDDTRILDAGVQRVSVQLEKNKYIKKELLKFFSFVLEVDETDIKVVDEDVLRRKKIVVTTGVTTAHEAIEKMIQALEDNPPIEETTTN